MKKLKMILLLTGLMMLLLPQPAQAALSHYKTDYVFSGEVGKTYMPDYPDFTDRIHRGLSQDDFNITYTFRLYPEQPVGFNEDGSITIEKHGDYGSDRVFYVVYEPKVDGKGWPAAFECILRAYAPLENFMLENDEVILATDETAKTGFYHDKRTMSDFTIKSYDRSIISVTMKRADNSDWKRWELTIFPVAKGETDIVIESFNGLQKSIHVKVGDPPSTLDFLQEELFAAPGERADAAVDLGGGVMWSYAHRRANRNGRYYDSESIRWYPGFFSMRENKPGIYDYTVTTYNDYSDKIRLYVYSKENCRKIELKDYTGYVNEATQILLYDGDGEELMLPMEITRGAEFASIQYDMLKATAPGTVEITVHNPDGSTIARSINFAEKPTEIILNAESLTMNIGDTFDLEVSFDKGTAACRFSARSEDMEHPYDLEPIRVAGNRIYADAPGSGWVGAYAAGIYKSIRVVVLPGEKELRIDRPEGVLAAGESYQLAVVDQTGRKYPAVFRCENKLADWAVSVTQDGLMTGHMRGKAYIHASLEDGRDLTFEQEVMPAPKWIWHSDMYYNQDAQYITLGEIRSDYGELYGVDVRMSIADEKIATFDGRYFVFHKEGTTKVTLTSVMDSSVQTSFNLTVIKKDYRAYYDSMEYRVPEGYQVQLPQATQNGNAVSLEWMIIYQDPGEGNPNKTGFKLSGDLLECTWGDAFCQLTGTFAGKRYRVDVYGYRLAEEIRFQKEEYVLTPSMEVNLEIIPMQADAELGPVMWIVENEDLLRCDTYEERPNALGVRGLYEGSTRVGAMLANGAYAECLVTIKYEAFPGDADRSKELDNRDVLLILQKEAGWEPNLHKENADVNDDGAVDMQDAFLILRKMNGEPVLLK